MDDNLDDSVNNLSDSEEKAVQTPEEGVGESAESAAENAEDKSGISSDLIRGHINTIILRSLYERDKYGYEIISDIERKSHNQYTLKQPTLYSALKRLENQGYILAYWKTDEVSSGGRRKYFTLTDSGREITEKNLAEWEYSRTIIDSLISDRSFDFTQPAPTPVDFTILRNSVSRVPVVKAEEDSENGESEGGQASQTAVRDESSASPTAPFESQPRQAEQPVDGNAEETAKSDGEQQLSEEELAARRRAHENYLRLISEPVVTETKPVEDIVPNSENINADRILYNVKPETERDYKNLINGIYNKAVANGRVETSYGRRETRSETIQRPKPDSSSVIINRGRSDGVRITPSTEYDARSTYATKTTYNKGMTLAISSSAVLFILLVEFLFCMIFRTKLNVPVIYPVTLLLIGLIQFAVFGGLFLKGYGANCAKPMSSNYISKSVVVTIILILIICVCSFLFHINFTLASDIMKLIVIPIITALNIIVFALVFYLQVK